MSTPAELLGPVDLADPVNADDPLNRDLALWLLTLPGLDGGPRWYDLLARSPGALENTGAGFWKAHTRPGGAGGVAFDGSNDLVRVADAPHLDATGGVTVAMWVRFRTFSGGDTKALFCKGRNVFGGSDLANYAVDYIPSGSMNLYFNDGLFRIHSTASSNFAADVWYFLTFTFQQVVNDVVASIYKDGRLVEAGTLFTVFLANSVTANDLGIGRMARDSSNAPADVDVDDFSIRTRALSAAEVRELYDASRQGYPAQLRRRSLWLQPEAAGEAGGAGEAPVVSSAAVDFVRTHAAGIDFTRTHAAGVDFVQTRTATVDF